MSNSYFGRAMNSLINTEVGKKSLPMLYLGLVVTTGLLAVGATGMSILMDDEGTGYLTNTTYGKAYRRLVQWNPFFSAFFFNGGLIGSIFFLIKINEVRKGTPAIAKAQQKTVEGAKKEGKKDK